MSNGKMTLGQIQELIRIDERRQSRGVPGIGLEASALIHRLGERKLPVRTNIDALTTEQIAALTMIDMKRIRGKLSGIAPDVQEIIFRLTSGGIGVSTNDPRVTQAKCLWDKGWGNALGYPSFGAYLESVPALPEWDTATKVEFHYDILVDHRLKLPEACDLLTVAFPYQHDDFVDTVLETRSESPYWIRCQDVRKHMDLTVVQCQRKQFSREEEGLALIEGLCFFAQEPALFEGHYLVFSGTVFKASTEVSVLTASPRFGFARRALRPSLDLQHAYDAVLNVGIGSRAVCTSAEISLP